MSLPYCVYVLISLADFELYTGFTTNLQKRLADHNKGGTKSTKGRRPLELIFCEYYLVKADAQRREGYLKTTAGKKALKLMLRDTYQLKGYNRL